MSEIKMPKQVNAEVVHNHPINPNTTVIQDSVLVHLLVLNDINLKIEREVAQMEERKEKMDKINKAMQELGARIDDKQGHIDLTKHAEFIESLLDAEELGIKLPINKPAFNDPSYKTLTREQKKNLIIKECKQLSSKECTRLEENLRYKMEDFNRDDATQARKIQVLFEKHEQFIMMLRDTTNTHNGTMKKIIDGIGRG